MYVPRDPDDSRIGIDISAGSVSMTASQLIREEALARKNAAVASNALSMAEYIYNYPGIPKGAKIVFTAPAKAGSGSQQQFFLERGA